jgi:hypothetical protein
MADNSHDERGPRFLGSARWVFWGFLAVAAYFLIMEHSAHTVQYLPYVLLLACPLMHFFHGHGGHAKHAGQESKSETPGDKKHGCH